MIKDSNNGRRRYGDGITERRRQVREAFKASFTIHVDRLGITQSDVIRQVNAIFQRDQVFRIDGDPASHVRTVPAWELSRWARGTITPDPQAVRAIAEVLQVTPRDLLPEEAVTEVPVVPATLTSSFAQVGETGYHWNLTGLVTPQVHRRLLEALAA